jgi:hypothetical protein
MEIEGWTGRIMCNKKRNELINFRAEPELVERLRKMENKSEFIRKAVKEKLSEIPRYYAISEIVGNTYDKNNHKLYKV